jgi:hypothetical protein
MQYLPDTIPAHYPDYVIAGSGQLTGLYPKQTRPGLFTSPLFGNQELMTDSRGFKHWKQRPTEASVYLRRNMPSFSELDKAVLEKYIYPHPSVAPRFTLAERTPLRLRPQEGIKGPAYTPGLTAQQREELRRRAIMSGMGETFMRALQAEQLAEERRVRLGRFREHSQ